MRPNIPALFAIGMLFMPASGHAQTYDPRYPVCLQTWSISGSNINCSYMSLAQCRDVASGRGGTQCLTNPFFAGPGAKPSGQRRVY